MEPKLKKILVVLMIAAILLVSIAVVVDTDQTEEFGDEKEASTLSGVMSAFSALTDNVGNIIWSSADEASGFPQSIIDPTSGLEVNNFYMGARYEATGTNIDWSTMKVEVKWQFFEYSSPNAYERPCLEWDTQLLTGQQNGDLQSTSIDLDPLIPEDILMVFWYLDEEGNKAHFTETYPQRTADSHPMQFWFIGRYYVEVYDADGYLYESYMEQNVKLTLQWAGSSFEITWQDLEDDEPDAPISVAPVINHIADIVALQGDIPIFTWNTADMNNDIVSYTISIDDVVVFTSAFTGGTLSWGRKWGEVGTYNIRVVVEDAIGNTCQDEVTVTVYQGVEPRFDETDPPTDPIDPSKETNGIQTFDEYTDDASGIPAGSVFGGQGGNTQVLILLAVVGGVGWLLYNRKKR